MENEIFAYTTLAHNRDRICFTQHAKMSCRCEVVTDELYAVTDIVAVFTSQTTQVSPLEDNPQA